MTAPASTSQPMAPEGRGTVELCAVSDLGDDARALLEAGAPAPRAFIALLCEREMHADAIRFLAHALPCRESVWWAWVCARKAAGEAPEPAIKGALDAAERW